MTSFVGGHAQCRTAYLMRRYGLSACAGTLRLAGRRRTPTPTHRHARRARAPADFASIPYANPDAPKGGAINYAWSARSTASIPFIVQGSGARGTIDLVFGNNRLRYAHERSADEPFSLYPLLAKSIETDDERTFVEFTLDERAQILRWRAGEAGRRDFHLRSCCGKGLAALRRTASKIDKVEKVGDAACVSTSSGRPRACRSSSGLSGAAQTRDRRPSVSTNRR
jgi:hypothetical protein